MHVDHHPFIADHPEWSEIVHQLKQENHHFARLLREYEWIDKEICRAEDGVEWYNMWDVELENLKKERLVVKDMLLNMVKGKM